MKYEVTYEVETSMNLPILAKFLYSKMPNGDSIVSIRYIGDNAE